MPHKLRNMMTGDSGDYAEIREHWFEILLTIDGEERWFELVRKNVKITDSHKIAAALCALSEKSIRYTGVKYAVYRCTYIGDGEVKAEVEI